MNKARNISGKFAPKSETPRKIRSVNLTDDAWQWLADTAARVGVSRNDYLEALADGATPLMEMVKPQVSPIIETVETDDKETLEQRHGDISPFIETVSHALTTPEEALAQAAIYGFTPEEALADAHFQIAMIEANRDEFEDRHDAIKREYATLRESFKELEADRNRLDWEIGIHKSEKQKLRDELEASQSEYTKLLESSSAIIHKSKEDLKILQTRLTQERVDREEVETELSDLKQKSATAGGFPDLTEKSGELLSLFKSLLPAKAKLPNGLVSKIRKILEGTQDE
ncbi:hypothetical protein QUB36_29710 [Microcoleus sp. AT8-B1]|uniref:hypothetical protein n=1 Tax=unclassified Microcoleus TaxID=2642155 RepID=UPI002FD7996B